MNVATSITITNGKAVSLVINWLTPEGQPEVPSAVRYEVFDWLTGTSVAGPIDVLELGAEMNFVVPASALVNDGTVAERRLAIQIEATFSNPDDKDIERVDVTVMKSFEMSEG